MSEAPPIRIAWREVARPGRDARRAVAWYLVRELAGQDAAIDNRCPRCGGPHGPVTLSDSPYLASVTYAVGGGRTVAIAGVIPGTDAAAFGLDAEPADREPGDALGRPASVRDWVRVEAALKADRRGLRVDAASVVVHADPPTWRAEVPGRPDVLRGIDLDGPDGIAVSAAWAPAEAREAASRRATR
jgi:4'-phosphopantetheinyl transferase